MSGISQKQSQKLIQKLSPQQIQMIKLLELPAMQLEAHIKKEIEENPILEEEERQDETGEEKKEDISMEEYLREDDTPSYKYKANNYSKDDQLYQAPISSGRSMHEYLEEQLGYKSLSERDALIAGYLVGSIDDDGYLHRGLESITDDIAFNLGIEVSVADLERVLKVIHTLEPVGVGSRNLRECLLLQLDSHDSLSKASRLARKIIDQHFDVFSKKHYEKIMSRMGITEDEFRSAIEVITSLSPKPGNLYNDGSNDVEPYIIPDFILNYQNGKFELSLNSYNVPDIRVNKRYVEMIREMAARSGAAESDKEAMQFVKNKIDSAKWFISAIKQRHDTLLFTMQEILDYQKEYFEDGDQSKLHPMILKDIADRTGLDVSTISRVVNSKYIQTHFGILSLKQLFSEAMQTESGEEVSSYEIKQILTDCIENEDKRRPLTDEQLMDILNERGYLIARRTVAKYREMLGISVARLRKQL